MSRTKDNYENSLWLKFKKWIDGETDLLADGMEIRVPEKDSKVLSQAAQSAQAELPGYDPAKAARMRKKEEHGLLLFHRFYQVMSVLLCLTIILSCSGRLPICRSLEMQEIRTTMRCPPGI